MNQILKRLALQLVMAIPGLVVCSHALADNCYAAYVVDVAVDNGGTVWLTTSSVPLNAICNISAKGPYTMDANSCNAALAMLISARIASRPVSVQYASGTCSAPGRYSAYYVQLN